MAIGKKISEYGFEVLDELSKDRGDFRNGKMEIENAKTIATMCNSTSRAMGETLRARRFETATAIAAA